MNIKLKPLRKAVLTIDDKQVEVERLGKGRYTTAWANCSNVYLQTHEKDYSKEILSRIEPMKHLPQVKLLGEMQPPWRLYQEPKYEPLMASERKAWEDFKVLTSLIDDTRKALIYNRFNQPWDAYSFNGHFLELVECSLNVSADLKDAIRELINAAGNYSQYCIEITKKNCAVDGDGNLILLDPLFDLDEVRSSMKARADHRRW